MKRVFSSFAHLHLTARLGISLFLVLFAAIALAPAAGPQKQIKSGVRIAGLNVAGFDVGQARQRVRTAFAQPVKFRFGKLRWQVAPQRLGPTRSSTTPSRGRCARMRARTWTSASPSTSSRCGATSTRSSGGSASDGERGQRLIALDAAGRPSISDERWGRTVRHATMTAAITRALRTRIRGRLPIVMRSIRPTVTKAGFGPVVVINRGAKVLTLFDGSSVGDAPARGLDVHGRPRPNRSCAIYL